MRPARILVLRGIDGPGGGAEQIILRNATHVDPRRFAHTICFFRHVHDPHFDLDRRCRDAGVDYRLIQHRGALDWSVLAQLRRVVAEVKPQLFHTHDYKASFFANRLWRNYRLPRVATCHGWTGTTWRERWIYYPADKRQLRHFEAVIAVSDAIREELLQAGVRSECLHVLLNGIDPRDFPLDPSARATIRSRWGWEDDAWILGGVGRVEQQKRFDLMVEAFARIHQREPRARLVIAGDGSLLPALQADVAARGLTEVCRLLGHVPQTSDVYPGLDVLVQSSDYEGTPTVILEAMAQRIPVVATDVGGTRQLLASGREGMLVPRRDVEQWVSVLLAQRHDPQTTTTWVEAAYQRATTEFTFQRRTERLEAIYQSLLGPARK